LIDSLIATKSRRADSSSEQAANLSISLSLSVVPLSTPDSFQARPGSPNQACYQPVNDRVCKPGVLQLGSNFRREIRDRFRHMHDPLEERC
jgi:hypothetical protein